VGGHALLTTPVEGPWIISDAHETPAGAPHVHELITEIFSEPTHGIAGAYPGRLIRGFIVERRCESSRPWARCLPEQAERGREAVGDAGMVSPRHHMPCGDHASPGREPMRHPRLKLGLEEMHRTSPQMLADLLHVAGDRSPPSTARWHRSPPGRVAQST
jgi:hypothetical protein